MRDSVRLGALFAISSVASLFINVVSCLIFFGGLSLYAANFYTAELYKCQQRKARFVFLADLVMLLLLLLFLVKSWLKYCLSRSLALFLGVGKSAESLQSAEDFTKAYRLAFVDFH